jgi:hypothetical protein
MYIMKTEEWDLKNEAAIVIVLLHILIAWRWSHSSQNMYPFNSTDKTQSTVMLKTLGNNL